jgi:hypothetical protein
MKKRSKNNSEAKELIKFENELLKLKLDVEFGLNQHNISALEPEVENAWLSSIYEFEQQFKDAKKIKVFEALGRPETKKLKDLRPHEIPKALDSVFSLMRKKGIALDCCCKYDEAIIYRFITEELFEEEVDDIFIDGMVHHFIYEEFHPNHEYDLKEKTEWFLRDLLDIEWSPEFQSHKFTDTVTLKGRELKKAALTSIIQAFQSDRTFRIESMDILQLNVDITEKKGFVKLHLAYNATFQRHDHLFHGEAKVSFVLVDEYWLICGFHLPGM